MVKTRLFLIKFDSLRGLLKNHSNLLKIRFHFLILFDNICSQLLFGPLAQLVEQWTFNPLVVGSNPTRPTILVFSLNICSRGRHVRLKCIGCIAFGYERALSQYSGVSLTTLCSNVV